MKKQNMVKRSNSISIKLPNQSIYNLQNYNEKPVIYYKFRNHKAPENENYIK